MGGMPYHLEKGPIFATFEGLYNDERLLRRFLKRLWLGQPLGTLGALTSPAADDLAHPGTANATGAKRKKSLLEKWFGEIKADGTQPAFGELDPITGEPALTTGYWFQYHGDVRGIVGETLTRAAEVSLGVDRPPPSKIHAAMALPAGCRHWPVEFFWHCGQPRFEGWVTWRRHGRKKRRGQVTVVFSTPATPDEVFDWPVKGADAVGDGMWDLWQGMWVSTHEENHQWLLATSLPTPSARWIVPTTAVMYTEGRGAIGTWAPTFGNGGAAPAPVPFEKGPA